MRNDEQIHADECVSVTLGDACDCGTDAFHDGMAEAERRIIEFGRGWAESAGENNSLARHALTLFLNDLEAGAHHV